MLAQIMTSKLDVDLKTYIWLPYSFLPDMAGQACHIMTAIKAEKYTLHICKNLLSQKQMLCFMKIPIETCNCMNRTDTREEFT